MIRVAVVFAWLLSSVCASAQNDKRPSYPSYDYDLARAHEIKPHRRTIPVEGVGSGFNQLRLTLTVSPTSEVIDADAGGDLVMMKYWLRLRPEVLRWKFAPFEEDGKSVAVELEEYIDLVPRNERRRFILLPPCFGQIPKLRLHCRGRDATARVLPIRLQSVRTVSCSMAKVL
jgi:hypothetical protein